jgi:hypothetical protein
MENPWSSLRENAPYVLDEDRKEIEQYAEIDTSLVPEPFIGNPASAKVLLLNLNPGWDQRDAEAHADAKFKAAMFRNLRHEKQEYPFYPLNPEFEWTPCAKWWLKKTRKLIEECGRSKVADGLLVIEWFPYHSREWNGQYACTSQEYSFYLARQVIDSDVPPILMRKRQFWEAIDARIGQSPPRSFMNPALTPKNYGEDVFRRMADALNGAQGANPENMLAITKENIENVVAILPDLDRISSDQISSLGRGLEPTYHPHVLLLMRTLQLNNFIQPFDWTAWQSEAANFVDKPGAVMTADLETCSKLLTLHVRKERFCGGHFGAMVGKGHIATILRRLRDLALQMK